MNSSDISIGVRAAAWTLILSFVGAVLIVAVAQGKDNGQWEGTDESIRQWYRTLMQPDNVNVSCCGEADAYYADKVEVINGETYATITDTREDAPLGRPHIPPGTRIPVPNYKLKWDRGNPTGHNVIFVNSSSFQVLCFVQSSGV